MRYQKNGERITIEGKTLPLAVKSFSAGKAVTQEAL